MHLDTSMTLRDEGVSAYRGKRRENPDTHALAAFVSAALQQRLPDGGVWTGPKVARYVHTRWGVEVGPVTGCRWLRALGFTLQVPRPIHPRAADRPGVEKNLRRRVRRLRAANPKKAVEVWAEDEARLGLKPISRRVWWLKGAGRDRAGGPGTSGSTSTGSPGPNRGDVHRHPSRA